MSIGPSGTLLEREDELSRAGALLRRARDGEGAVLVVEGAAGSGKTRLLREISGRAEGQGFGVLAGRGAELERDFAFGLLRQVLEPALASLDGEIDGVGALTPDGTYAGSGTVTITTASGDELTGTFTITTSEAGSGTEATVVVTITGGTGRFADASGTLTVICQAPAPAPVGDLLVSTGDCRLSGTIDP